MHDWDDSRVRSFVVLGCRHPRISVRMHRAVPTRPRVVPSRRSPPLLLDTNGDHHVHQVRPPTARRPRRPRPGLVARPGRAAHRDVPHHLEPSHPTAADRPRAACAARSRTRAAGSRVAHARRRPAHVALRRGARLRRRPAPPLGAAARLEGDRMARGRCLAPCGHPRATAPSRSLAAPPRARQDPPSLARTVVP